MAMSPMELLGQSALLSESPLLKNESLILPWGSFLNTVSIPQDVGVGGGESSSSLRDTAVTQGLRKSQSRPRVSEFPAPVLLWRTHIAEATSSLPFQGFTLKKKP